MKYSCTDHLLAMELNYVQATAVIMLPLYLHRGHVRSTLTYNLSNLMPLNLVLLYLHLHTPKMYVRIIEGGYYSEDILEKQLEIIIHNHMIHSLTRICTKVKEIIADAATCNQAIKPSQISKGQGIGVVPGAIDGASNHSGKLQREVHRAKQSSISGLKWNISDFKDVANEIDSCDERLAGDIVTSGRINKMHRPYLITAGFEDSFIMCMSPQMVSVLSQAEFVEADIALPGSGCLYTCFSKKI